MSASDNIPVPKTVFEDRVLLKLQQVGRKHN